MNAQLKPLQPDPEIDIDDDFGNVWYVGYHEGGRHYLPTHDEPGEYPQVIITSIRVGQSKVQLADISESFFEFLHERINEHLNEEDFDNG